MGINHEADLEPQIHEMVKKLPEIFKDVEQKVKEVQPFLQYYRQPSQEEDALQSLSWLI